MPVIVYSIKDPAGKNIAGKLVAKHGFAQREQLAGRPCWQNEAGVLLVEVETDIIHTDYLDEITKTDYFVMASRHKSVSGKPTLTVHPTGNWSAAAEMGGRSKELAFSLPEKMKLALQYFSSHPIEGFEISYEATHHGPTVPKTPLFFIEIGSSEDQWIRDDAGEAVAAAIMHAIENHLPQQRNAIGIGSIHYPRSFTKRALETDVALGHMLPKYMFNEFNTASLKQAIEKTVGGVQLALIEWKSLKAPERAAAIELLAGLGLAYEKT